MLYNLEKRIGVLLIPKTGSSALHHVLQDRVAFDYSNHEHATVSEFDRLLENDGYTCIEHNRLFGMYRDPIDRFVSGCNYFRTALPAFGQTILEYLGYHLDYFERAIPIGKKEHLEAINNATVKDIFESFKMIERTGSEDKIKRRLRIWRPQCEYLDHPKVELLDYRDMVGSANRVLEAFSKDHIDSVPLVNVTESKIYSRDALTAEDIAAIKEYYKADYEFFEKKGISFEV